MNILVTLNSAYVGPLTVLLKSLMISNPEGRFDLFVAHSSLTEEDFEFIGQNIDKNRVTVHSVSVDPKLLENAPILKRTSKETYYRLLLLEYLPKELDRILYIDPDTVVIKNIEPFYNIDFKGKALAAAGHTKSWVEFLNKKRFGFKEGERYFNAGIIMFNLQRMRNIVTTQQIFDYIRKHEKWLFLADQDVLNGMFHSETLFVDECIYNLDEKTVRFNQPKVTPEWIEKNTVIVHFNGKYKPWKPDYKGILEHYYFDYLNAPKIISTKVG